MVKVELHETNPSTPLGSPINIGPTTPLSNPTCTPPPSTSGLAALAMPSLSRIPTMPPLHLPTNAGVGVRTPNQEQLMMNHTAEMLAKQNMFCFLVLHEKLASANFSVSCVSTVCILTNFTYRVQLLYHLNLNLSLKKVLN